jgi:hypothetical protein
VTIIPAEWSQLGGEIPLLEKGVGIPFLITAENAHEVILYRNQLRACFRIFEVTAEEPAGIKAHILDLMRDLYNTWNGLLPEQGHQRFYGVFRERGVERSGLNWVRVGLGYTTYPIGELGYVRTMVGYSTIPLTPIRTVDYEGEARAWCEKNQLPCEFSV